MARFYNTIKRRGREKERKCMLMKDEVEEALTKSFFFHFIILFCLLYYKKKFLREEINIFLLNKHLTSSLFVEIKKNSLS